jgi:hypothetical protein
MDDRRQHERLELLAQVALRRSGQIEAFPTINISAGGILLRNDRNVTFEINEQIRIAFDVPELAPAFAIDARVVRVVAPTTKPGLMAAMWTSSDAGSSDCLAQVLWRLRSRQRSP